VIRLDFATFSHFPAFSHKTHASSSFSKQINLLGDYPHPSRIFRQIFGKQRNTHILTLPSYIELSLAKIAKMPKQWTKIETQYFVDNIKPHIKGGARDHPSLDVLATQMEANLKTIEADRRVYTGLGLYQ
jgi:hypothetical protein